MRSKLTLGLAWVLMGGLGALDAHAQRGVGDPIGIALQAVKPEVVSLSGTVQAIVIEPCEKTTGQSAIGTHILLETTEADPRNIHLGPAASVGHITDKLVVGQNISVQAFQTNGMPQDEYVAASLTIGDEMIQLRDEDLRPVWAVGREPRRGPGRSQAGRGNGRGPGPGRGAAYGRGRGPSRNAAYGQGRGRGRNAAVGQGRGGGRGRGWGQGPGRGWGGGRGQGPGQGSGQGPCLRCEQQLGAVIDSLSQSELSEQEREGLLLMREEEKLAHDVYTTLGKKWALRPFANIPQAEARHMDFVKMLLDRYGQDDPIHNMTVGKFPSRQMQMLYDQLVAQGEGSVEESIKVGALIEELDIADLRRLINETDNDDIKVVYQNLLKGSRNHIRAFARQLIRYETTYTTRHLSQTEFERIASSNHERGVIIDDPNYKF